MAPPTEPLNLDVEAISGICGSISIACWVVVFSPQIFQNFQRGSADGLSIQFIIVWLIGDLFNILGAVKQGVLPTMIILAFYYTLADVVLLLQCFYYRGFTWKDEVTPTAPKPTNGNRPNERTGLLHDALLHEGSRGRPRRGSDWSNLSPAVPLVPEALEEPAPTPTVLQTVLWNALAVVMVCCAGILGWFLSRRGQGYQPPSDSPSDGQPDDPLALDLWGQIFGYLCAALYILSRVPQLILNYKRKSTDGLSMLFFLFACLGNIMYVLSIFAYEPKCKDDECAPGEVGRIYGRYMLLNLSWLAGSLVTLLLDFGVFTQYFMYLTPDSESSTISEYAEEEDVDNSPWDRPLLARGDSTFG
ncbi:related to PQ loop repeat protein [Cephalotrichum gorgonifer]|uniref:Related to PQ loop repeat protein n=1 Tax=Cephalotrichum gorgonifer TaxID=2041049 RepID=A0AAE8SVK3_9PEZI|nr:related to PQ loop repeat protein [Cephalotrichum gorgonifer]